VPVKVSFSIGTLDESVWRATEPGTPHPRRRLDAMRAMVDAGIPTGALIAPVLPGLSDRRDQLAETVAAVLETGGSVMGSRSLYLRGATRDHFLGWLKGHDPELHSRYLKAFRGRTEVTKDYDAWVRAAIAAEVKRHRS
jgi:DNA repair photolyase